jgi:phosphofructokinase-like protein
MSTGKPTIGILTSGGDCPGLNAVIRAATKTAERLGYDCIGFLKGYEGLVDPVAYMPLDSRVTADILLKGGTILGSSNKGRFTALVGEGERVRIDPDLLDRAALTVHQLGVAGLVCVGGDGSLAIAQQLHERGIPVVGVPKTIDNDLGATAFTFGFDSAVATATDALDRLHTTAASHERVMVLEVMGRHAGWIALHAGIAGGGDVILLPEIPWTFENVCRKVVEREAEGKRFTLVVAAEGATLPGGGLVHAGEHPGERRQVRLGGIGEIVASEISVRLDRDVRAVVLGHLQRGGTPTAFDRMLATEFGAHAVRLVHEGRFGETVCYRPPEIASVPIATAIRQLSTVDPHGSAVQAARALGIGFGDDADHGDPFRSGAAAARGGGGIA